MPIGARAKVGGADVQGGGQRAIFATCLPPLALMAPRRRT